MLNNTWNINVPNTDKTNKGIIKYINEILQNNQNCIVPFKLYNLEDSLYFNIGDLNTLDFTIQYQKHNNYKLSIHFRKNKPFIEIENYESKVNDPLQVNKTSYFKTDKLIFLAHSIICSLGFNYMELVDGSYVRNKDPKKQYFLKFYRLFFLNKYSIYYKYGYDYENIDLVNKLIKTINNYPIKKLKEETKDKVLLDTLSESHNFTIFLKKLFDTDIIAYNKFITFSSEYKKQDGSFYHLFHQLDEATSLLINKNIDLSNFKRNDSFK